MGIKGCVLLVITHLNAIATVPLSNFTVPINFEEMRQLTPTTARSKARVYGSSLAGIMVSNLACGMDVC
jgi:hypothetical protein